MSNTLASPDRARVPTRAARALRRGAEFRRWRARVADLLEALAIGSVVLVVAQFLASGGSHALLSGDVGARLTAVGRLTGLVAMDLLLLQVLLAARVPWVDRVYGMDRALAAHRILGRITVPLVLIHVGAIVLGYASADGLTGPFGWLRELLILVTGGDDLLLALLATAALVAIAVTSVRIARRRLSYEWWHAVHLMAYAAVILAVPHQISLGTDFNASLLSRAYWWTLWVVVAASVAWWRVLLPVARSARHGLRVTEVRPEGPGVWSVVVRGRHLDRLDVRAGQFFNWRFVTPSLFFAAHPWSLSAAPDGRTLRITVRALGDHSARIADLRPGTFVLVEGPYGAFTTQARTRPKVLLIAAGIGVTPVRALLEELVLEGHAAPGDVTVVYRANDVNQLPLHSELERLASLAGHQVLSLVGPPASGSALPSRAGGRGSDGERLTRIVPDLADHEVYLCGPLPWMTLVHKAIRDAGVPAAHIHDERFAW
ncbi:ferric reductase-like transmembrane domain-containing protein [Intrasporangium mesophilum]